MKNNNTFKSHNSFDFTNAFKAQSIVAQTLSNIDLTSAFKAQSVMAQTLSNIDLTSAFKAQSIVAQALSNIDLTSAFKAQSVMSQTLSNIDLTSAFKAQSIVAQALSNIDLTSAFKAQSVMSQTLSNIDLTSAFKAQSIVAQALSNIDLTSAFKAQSVVAQQLSSIFDNINISSFKNLHSAFDYLSEQYILYNDIEEYDDKKEILDIANNILEGNSLSKSLSPKQKEFFTVYLYPFILMIIPIIISLIISKPSIINNYQNIIYNPISTVNEYYTVQEGFSKDFLNDNNIRIISVNDTIIREKHDCSSKIIEKLQIGKVVCIIDKYKKWVRVSWSNENGEFYRGWLQNYKLSRFK